MPTEAYIANKAFKKMTEKQSSEISFKPKILVVDDEKVIREGSREVLAPEGFEVLLAENGEQGLKMIEKAHFDVILLDLMMPGLSGFDVLSHVKARHPDTSIIVITGYATIENSIEAMKNGGNLSVRSGLSDDVVEIKIEDDGCGIGEGDMEKIFSPFYTTKQNGTGLGLSISKSIIEAHEGSSFTLQSEAGKGATFRITMPVCRM